MIRLDRKLIMFTPPSLGDIMTQSEITTQCLLYNVKCDLKNECFTQWHWGLDLQLSLENIWHLNFWQILKIFGEKSGPLAQIGRLGKPRFGCRWGLHKSQTPSADIERWNLKGRLIIWKIKTQIKNLSYKGTYDNSLNLGQIIRTTYML